MWLDAGIVPFSTLGWENPEWVDGGLRDGRRQGADDGRPARPRVLGEVVPGRLGLGDARADPAVVLLAALHVGRAHGRAPFRRCSATRRCSTRRGREMHGSWGNTIEAGGRVRAHGRRRDALAVLRAAARPEPALRLRARGGDQARAAHALELGEVLRRLREHRRVPPVAGRPRAPAGDLQPLDRWLVERTRAFVAEATDAYERYLTVDVMRAFEAYVDDLSNWYIRRSRRRFWDGDDGASHALVRARADAARDRAGHAVPHRASVAQRSCSTGPSPSTSPAGRRSRRRTARCSTRWATCAASSTLAAPGALGGGASSCGSRCAARRRGRVERAAHADEIADELRVKEVAFGKVDARAAREAEPAGARAAARQGAADGAAGAAGGRVRGARRRPLPRRGPRARAGRGARRARRPRRAGPSRRRTASRSRSTRRSTTSCCSKAAATT